MPKPDPARTLNPPIQRRGQRTLERIVAATERLLRRRSFDDITIADIVTEADASTGSFYARFASKDALLPYVYDLYNAELDAEWTRIEAQGGLPGADLHEAVHAFVDVTRLSVGRMRWLLKAMAVYARRHPGQLPRSSIERNERIYRVAAASFTPHMTCRRQDAERRARMATFAIITLLRERELFGDAPLAAALAAERGQFAKDLEDMAIAYLASD